MVEYYKLDLDSMAKYYAVENGDAVGVSVSGVDGASSTASTNATIMDEVEDAEKVSASEVPDDVLEKLQQGKDNLL